MQSTATKELQKVISDNRYTIALEHTGLPVATYVIRFCDNFIGQGQTLNDAIMQAIFHQGERIGLL